jgi:hypothetical protein
MSVPLCVEATPTVDDLVAMHRHLMRGPASPAGGRGRRFLATVAIWLPIGLVGSLVWARAPDPIRSLLLVALFLAGAVFSTWQQRRYVRQCYAAMTNLLVPTRFEAGEEGLRVSTKDCDALVRWTGIESVATDDRCAYVGLSALQAFAVPRGAFGDRAAFDEFVAMLRARARRPS